MGGKCTICSRELYRVMTHVNLTQIQTFNVDTIWMHDNTKWESWFVQMHSNNLLTYFASWSKYVDRHSGPNSWQTGPNMWKIWLILSLFAMSHWLEITKLTRENEVTPSQLKHESVFDLPACIDTTFKLCYSLLCIGYITYINLCHSIHIHWHKYMVTKLIPIQKLI